MRTFWSCSGWHWECDYETVSLRTVMLDVCFNVAALQQNT